MTRFVLWSSLLLALALAGCASTPPATRFVAQKPQAVVLQPDPRSPLHDLKPTDSLARLVQLYRAREKQLLGQVAELKIAIAGLEGKLKGQNDGQPIAGE
jgi:hypothetical protein